MKSTNYYWKKIYLNLGGESLTNRKPNNYYLRKIYEHFGGTAPSKAKSDNYYLKEIEDATKGGCGGDCDVKVDYSLIDDSHSYLNNLITEVKLPSTITEIPYGMFSSLKSMQSIIIPDSVTSIGTSAFGGCSILEEITLSNNLTTIGNGLFSSCTSLKEIDIPPTLTTIGYSTFSGCTSLEKVNLYWESNPITYDFSKWSLPNGAVFTIPYGTTSIYESANYPSAKLVEREEE